MKLSIDTIAIAAALIIYIGGDLYTASVKHKELSEEIKSANQAALAAVIRTGNLEASVDSIKVQIKGLGKTVIYLDSCQQNKTQKADRAERRGKFVGGLLKSLIPGM